MSLGPLSSMLRVDVMTLSWSKVFLFAVSCSGYRDKATLWTSLTRYPSHLNKWYMTANLEKRFSISILPFIYLLSELPITKISSILKKQEENCANGARMEDTGTRCSAITQNLERN